MKSVTFQPLFYANYLLIGIVQLSVWLVVKNDPFFGDAIASTSQAANHIYAHNLTSLFYPIEADPGHPTLYSYVLASIWSIVGKSLPVSHAYSCVWAFLLGCAVVNLAKHFLQRPYLLVATACVVFFGTYLSQSAMMLNTVAEMTFFIWAVTAIYQKKSLQFIVAASFMCATHLQSAFLLLSLFSFDAYRNIFLLKNQSISQWITSRVVLYGIPFLVFCTWLYLHYQHTGWLVLSPHYHDADELNGPKEYIKAILTIGWRLIDYGMIVCYAVLFIAFFQRPINRSVLMQGLFLLAPCCIGMAIFLSNTIGHRYFLGFNILALVATVYILQFYNHTPKRWLLVLLVCSLVAGNFLVYPGKTLGDATLAYRSYFGLAQQVEAQFPATQFYSHAPIANPPFLTQLQEGANRYQRIHDTPFDSLSAIVQSNINAEFSEADKAYLTNNWYGKSYENGAVYVTVFFNPKYYSDLHMKSFREPAPFEKWMIEMKKQLK